ncbi:hypothetical protein SNE40_022983 [Patella caerulea]|uniref:Ubiquitin carboxyl-terminal hydrolase MINDY n=1 Tax=Patella caerulea TaxID=87958 RepID=A0AAN8FXF8_PATCE
MEAAFVEGIAASLVREYLSRKGLRSTLKIMDEEMPRSSDSISNRNALMQELHIEKAMKKNKEKEHPLRAMIEVIAEYHILQLENEDSLSSSYYPQTDVPSPIIDKPKHAASKLYDSSKATVYPSSPKYRPKTAGQLSSSKSSKINASSDLVIEDNLESETLLGDGKSGLFNSDKNDTSEVISKTRQARVINSKPRGLSAAVISNTEDAPRRRVPKSRPLSSMKSALNTHSTEVSHTGSTTPGRHYQHMDSDIDLSSRQQSRTNSQKSQFSLEESLHISKITPQKHAVSITDILDNAEAKSNGLSQKIESVENSRRYSVELSSMAADRPLSRSHNKKIVSEPSGKTVVGDVEFGDVDDLESDLNDLKLHSVQLQSPVVRNLNNVDSQPIDTKKAIALRTLLFGSAMTSFNDEWKYQSLSFCDIPRLQYGIVQKKGGACGVLAAIQACMIQEMLFGDNKLPSNRCFSPSREERSKFLAVALCKILWRAGGKSKAVVALPSGKTHVITSSKYKPDKLTETLMLYTFNNSEDLLTFFKQNISQFETDGCSGAVLVLYSAILTKGIIKVMGDFDEPGLKLMAAHGYCTQEMVNLLLTGRAVSNVFNDVMELESGGVITTLKGISSRSDIGFLSLFEHYKSCQVGTFYKTPKYPVWVVCSESHFSVLFSTRRELVNDWKAERRFDLYYYDGLSRQQEEIKLTIDTTNRSFRAPSDDDLVPPLEHCIRTKWADAEVDWNGYEPIL